MNELLIRVETLCLEVDPPLLIGVGAAMAIIGLVLWWGGTRYSTIVIGLLGAAVGAVVGLAVSQQLNVHMFGSMAVGAVVLGVVSVLLRNILIIVLAVAIFALVGAAGYAGVVLDGQPAEETTIAEGQPQTVGAQRFSLYQSFSSMDPNSRQVYLNEISGSEEGFQDRSKAILKDTWNALGSTKWPLVGAILIGGVAGFLLIWFIKQVIVPLCYSIVGTASLVLGVQVALLGFDVHLASSLPPQRWIVPAALGGMTVVGWVSQLLAARKPHAKAHKHEEEADDD